jgi:hypothetical protein
VPFALKVVCLSSRVGCDITLVFIFFPLPRPHTRHRMQPPKIKISTNVCFLKSLFTLTIIRTANEFLNLKLILLRLNWRSFIHQWLYSPLFGLDRLFSFVIVCAVCRTPSMGEQPVTRPLLARKATQTFFFLQHGCLHPVACTRSGSGFPSNTTLFRLLFNILFNNRYMFWSYDRTWTWQTVLPRLRFVQTTPVLEQAKTVQAP